MDLTIEHWNAGSDGELTEFAMCKKLQSRGYQVSHYVYPPGTIFPPHTHDVDKIDGVLSGRFLLQARGQHLVLEAGDLLAIPSGMVHSAEVLGDDAVVSLDAVKYQS